jgi:hypothetical protein
MKKKNLQNLKLNKRFISSLNSQKAKGGTIFITITTGCYTKIIGESCIGFCPWLSDTGTDPICGSIN